MSKVHVKQGDSVYVLSGRDRGKTGKVLQVDTKKGRVVVDGVNVVKKHTKARPPKEPEGGIKEVAISIDASNVKLNTKDKAKAKGAKAKSESSKSAAKKKSDK